MNSEFYLKNGKLSLTRIGRASGVAYCCVKAAVADGINPHDFAALRDYRDSRYLRSGNSLSKKKMAENEDLMKRISELRDRKYSMLDIEKEAGVCRSTVKSYLKQLGKGGKVAVNRAVLDGKDAAKALLEAWEDERSKTVKMDLLWANHPIFNRERQRSRYHSSKTPERMKALAANARLIYYKIRRSDEFKQRRRKIKKKWRSNPKNRIRVNLSTRLWVALKQKGSTKTHSIVDIVGCSIEQLIRHLEIQFIGCMTWENYGKAWHVDHIVPCEYFDLTKLEQQKRCFHFSNLRPLWARTNIKQGSKRGHCTFPLGI